MTEHPRDGVRRARRAQGLGSGLAKRPAVHRIRSRLEARFPEPSARRSAWLVIGGSTAASIVSLMLAASRLVLSAHDPVGYILLLGSLGFAACALVAMLRRSVAGGAWALPGVGLTSIAAMCLVEGGLFSEALFFLPFVPLLAVLTVGSRGAVVFLAFGLALVGVLFAADPVAKGSVAATMLHVAGVAGAVGFAGVLGLVYERSRLAAVVDLEQAKAAAEQASSAKTLFLTKMSHELRTPLNSVIGFSNLLLRKGASLDCAERDRHITRIRDNGGRLLQMVGDILDLTQVEGGERSIRTELLELRPLLQTAVERVSAQADERAIELRLDASAGTHLVADGSRLTRAVSNLLSNAIKFTEAGGCVWVALVCDAADQPARLDVSDSGIGIDAEALERIYEPFNQRDESESRSHFGAGVGLSISQRLCREMGFDLYAVSVLGKGSTFSILFGPQVSRPSQDELAARLSTVQPETTS